MPTKTPKKKEKIIWHSLNVDAVLKELKTSNNGLDEKQVAERLKKFGQNKLPEAKRISKLKLFFHQFRNPLIYILLIAAIITMILGEYSDMAVIMLAVIMNTIIGYIEESKADQALEKIKKLIKQRVNVFRICKNCNKEIKIDSSELVPGDIIVLSSGDRVPADARIIEANELKINEASLTGESMPVNKNINKLDKGINLAERLNMVYMGTTVMNGNGKAVICKTGVSTELGNIAKMVSETADEATPLQNRISRFSKMLSIVVLFLCLLIFSIGIIRDIPLLEMFLTAVAIAVAAIPEGLVVSVTIILALGMQRILKKKALVKRLVAAETLGSASVICMDKTGTLTENKMVVSHVIVESDNKSYDDTAKLHFKDIIIKSPNVGLALEIGMLCNNVIVENPKDELHSWILHGDPTEKALYVAAMQAGYRTENLEKEFPKLKEIPFNEEARYMATINKKGDGLVAYLKGAPEVIIDMSAKIDFDGKIIKITDDKNKKLKFQYEELTKKGLRVLAVGYKKFDNVSPDILDVENAEDGIGIDISQIIFVGFIGLKDPLRKDAKETISSCLSAGIRPILITGDHRLTAKAIIQEVGIDVKLENILEGNDLDKLSDQELKKIVRKIDVYARVSPRHKLRIVDAWQAVGETVAMTGDGVNDAPAIKSADIGIALGSGTDVSRETADIILLDDSFKTIIDIIKEGRVIFDNIRKVVLYLLSDSFSEMILITGSLLFGLPLPLIPAQILWINLITDGFPGVAMTIEPGEVAIEKEKPRSKKEPLLNSEIKTLIFIISVITAFILFFVYAYLLRTNIDLKYLRTLIFVLLGTDSLVYVFSCRSLRKPLWKIKFFSNKLLLLSVIFGFFMQAIAIYWEPLQNLLKTVPLTFKDWIIIIIFGIINIVLIEIVKMFFIVKRVRGVKS
ncbi:cation-translocating P-type ATPase [Patescibacteria group bacterium]